MPLKDRLRDLNNTVRLGNSTINGFNSGILSSSRLLGNFFTFGNRVSTQANQNRAWDKRTQANVVRADTYLIKAMGANEDAINEYMQRHPEAAKDDDYELSKKESRRFIALAEKYDAAKADGDLTPEEKKDLADDMDKFDKKFGNGKFAKLYQMHTNLRETDQNQAIAEQYTPVFIAALKDAVQLPVNSVERARAIGEAMGALDNMRDQYGVITLSEEVLKVLPGQQPNYSYNSRNPAPRPDNQLVVKSPADIIQRVTAELATRYQGTMVTAAELKTLTAPVQKTNDGVSYNDTPDNTQNGVAQNNVNTNTVANNTVANNTVVNNTVANNAVKEAPAFVLAAAPAGAAPIKGEPAVAGKIPKIAQNQVGDLQDQLVALAAVEGDHPALDALVKRLKEHPEQRGKFGKLTLAALAEATGMSAADLAKMDLTSPEASKDLIAKLQLPKKQQQENVATVNTPTINTGSANLTTGQTNDANATNNAVNTDGKPVRMIDQYSAEYIAFIRTASTIPGFGKNFSEMEQSIIKSAEVPEPAKNQFTPDGQMDTKELAVAMEMISRKFADTKGVPFSGHEMYIKPTYEALQKLSESTGVKPIDGVYHDTQAGDANLGNLGIVSTGAVSGKDVSKSK